MDVDGSVIRVFTVQPQKPPETKEEKKPKVEDVVKNLNDAIDYGDLKGEVRERKEEEKEKEK